MTPRMILFSNLQLWNVPLTTTLHPLLALFLHSFYTVLWHHFFLSQYDPSLPSTFSFYFLPWWAHVLCFPDNHSFFQHLKLPHLPFIALTMLISSPTFFCFPVTSLWVRDKIQIPKQDPESITGSSSACSPPTTALPQDSLSILSALSVSCQTCHASLQHPVRHGPPCSPFGKKQQDQMTSQMEDWGKEKEEGWRWQ